MGTEFSLSAVRFEDIRTGIVNYLKENGAYKATFDFYGSNIAYFIDTAAYLTMLISYQNTITSNNIFLDTTEIRKNAVSIVKRMGYRPKRKISSQFTGTIEYFASQDETFVSGDTVIIPARTIFTSSPNTYQFMNILPIKLTYDSDVLLSGPFIFIEGNFKTVTTFGTGKDLQEIIIDSEDVEENNMSVFVRTNNTATATNIQWSEVASFFSSTDDTIYFVEEDIVNEKRPKILFGDGTLGQVPKNTETIEIEYLETRGADANGETGVVFFDVGGPEGITVTDGGAGFSISDYTFGNLTINTTNLEDSFGGKDNGTLTEIQFNAPRFFSAAGRAVTKDDFLFQLSEFSSTLKYSNVIGGNVLFPDDPNELGVIYICGVPTGIDQDDFINDSKIYLTELEENVIIPQIEDKTVISTAKKFIKPSYVYLQLDPFIEVPESFSSTETQTTIAAVTKDLDTYITNNLLGLEKPFRHSKMLSSITTSIGVISADLDIIHNMIINGNSFYSGRESTMNFPVIFDRDSAGVVILDSNNVPTTSNFIKKRSDIITKENEKRISGAKESVLFTCLANTAGVLGGTYFTISDYTVLGVEVQYYVWLDSGSGSTDPAPSGITNGVQVNIQSGDTATEVAIAVVTALKAVNATNAFTVGSSDADITITNKNAGYLLNNAADNDSGFVFVLLTRGLDTNYYNQFTLPIAKSSIFSSLTHPNSDRKFFNIDVTSVEFIKFQLIGASGSEVLSYETFKFKDKNNITYIPNLVETSSTTWNVQINGRNIAVLNKISVTNFTLTGIDDNYLNNTVGIIPADGESNLLNVESITETDEKNVITTFFSVNFLLDNNVFTDIRLYGKTKLADAAFDAKAFTWAYTNTPLFEEEVEGGPVTFASQDAAAIDESFMEVTHINPGGKDIIFSMRNFNGTFTLNNFNVGDLTIYDFRDDLVLTTNYKLTQEPSKVIYQVSKQLTVDSENVQQINLVAAEITRITTQSNTNDVLDGTFFYLNSALDATNYYVWFSSPTSASNDPSPIGSFTGIEVDLGSGIDEAFEVATAIIGRLSDTDATDFSAANGDTNEVDITNTADGRCIDASLPTELVSKAYSYDVTGDTFTDETTFANNTTINNMTLLPSDGAEVDDAYYFGKNHKFQTLTLNIGTAGFGTWVVEWQYWNGTIWTDLSATDETKDETSPGLGAFTEAGFNNVTWAMPSAWATVDLNTLSGGPNSGTYYWVRAIVTTADISGITQPLGTQVFIGGLPRAQLKASDPNDADIFTLEVTTQGSDNLTVDMDKFQVDDLVTIIGSDTVNDDGTFIIKSINSTTGVLEVYNVNGVLDITGTATMTHYEVSSGTYGEFTIHGFDIYHDISIGKLKYATGVLSFNQTIKGYTDLANLKIRIKSIRSIFNHYTTTSRMDTIKIVPIDRFSNAEIFLGQQNDFDTGFNQSIETIISTPTIKT